MKTFFMLDNIPLKYVHCGLINNNSASVQVMVWQQSSGKPVFELTMTWWRHQMETFSALLAFCAGNSPVTGKFPSQRPVTQSFDVFFDL